MVMIEFWAIKQGVFDLMQANRHHMATVPAETIDAFIQTRSGRVARGEHMQVVGGSAIIPVVGVLTPAPDFFAAFFGGGNTVYGDIVAAIQQADGDPAVEKTILEISSPGGNTMGMFDAMAAIAGASKPVVAMVTDLAASAAFGLASQADQIIVNNPQAQVGSVGVVTQRLTDDSVKTITSTNAPRKRPDASTDEGVAMIQQELDALHAEFAGMIAEGRGTTIEDVNKNFGQGGMLLGKAALAAGMIDEIAGSNSTARAADEAGAETPESNAAASGGSIERVEPMDLNELQKQNPSLYAEAVKVGESNERERVGAHVIMGRASGDLEFALKCIEDGTAFTQTAQAHYQAAALKNSAIAAREEDNIPDVDAAAADDEAAATDKQLAAVLAAKWGVEDNG